ncbi:MAG: hypothetical protein JO250_20865 [Armatimonadetes bacterium]|nr:hypothetical protein [Armatimonadota bacterium]
MPTHEAAAPQLEIRLFGPVRVLLGGRPVSGLHRRQARWLLAALALR